MRKDARAGKADILGKTMALDSAQAAAFWPIYKQYEAELQTARQRAPGHHPGPGRALRHPRRRQGEGALDRQLALEEKKLALMKKYRDEMVKALPAKTVARWLQVESRLNKLVELTVASEIPLVY